MAVDNQRSPEWWHCDTVEKCSGRRSLQEAEIAAMKAGGEGGRVRGIIDPAVETDVIKLMAAAFDRALMSLALVPPDIVRDAMVRRIIEAAQAGERSLGELANAALGGADTRRQRD
jgi:hypothetical protein